MACSLEETKQALSEEAWARQALADRFSNSINQLAEKIDTLSRLQAEKVQDLSDQIIQVAMKTGHDQQDHSKLFSQLRSSVETIQVEASTRYKKLEDRTSSIEARMSDFVH